MRRPAARGRAGTIAQTLRRRLESNDKAWDDQVPDNGVEDLPVTSLRRLASALDVKQGDQTKGVLVEAIKCAQRERHAILGGIWH